MKIDFASFNLQYMIHIRDIAHEDPDIAARLLGLPPDLAEHLVQIHSDSLAKIAQVKLPLLVARGDSVWWCRLFRALVEENPAEIDAVLQAASLTMLSGPLREFP